MFITSDHAHYTLKMAANKKYVKINITKSYVLYVYFCRQYGLVISQKKKATFSKSSVFENDSSDEEGVCYYIEHNHL